MTNWNRLNNELSTAILAADLLGALLSELGGDLPESKCGHTFRGRCPVHRGDGDNFQVWTGGEPLPIYWRCFSHKCHKRGRLKNNLLGLARGALTGDPDQPETMQKTKKFLEDFLARNGASPSASSAPHARPVWRVPPYTSKVYSWTRAQVRARLDIPSRYFRSRGYAPDVLDSLDIGDSPKWGRAVIPVRNDDGLKFVGFISRSTKPYCAHCRGCHSEVESCERREERWLFPKAYERGEWLYNYDMVRQSDADFVLLVEGVPDVLAAASAGVPAVCAFGTDLSVVQTDKLVALKKNVLVAFDNDEVGMSAARATESLLQRQVRTVVRHPPREFKDVGEMSVAAVNEWRAIWPGLLQPHGVLFKSYSRANTGRAGGI